MALGSQLPKFIQELKDTWMDEGKNLGDKTTKMR